jgi:hypothetical protein
MRPFLLDEVSPYRERTGVTGIKGAPNIRPSIQSYNGNIFRRNEWKGVVQVS